MTKGTKQLTYLPDRYIDFIKFVEDHEITVFSLEQVYQWIQKDPIYVQEMLQNLVRKELLFRLERGKYARYGFKNDKVIGTFLASGSAIGYWSAMNLHGFTEQIPNVVFVQTTKFKRDTSVFNVPYKFIHILPEKLFGITTAGYGNETFPVTDKEKTLHDCFGHPEYTPGYDTVIRMFYHGNFHPETLLKYGERLGNFSTMKRLAYLSELFKLPDFEAVRQQIASKINNRYTLIDPTGPDEGEFVMKWKIRLNISNEDLISMVE